MGCGGSASLAPTSTPPPTPDPRLGGRLTVRLSRDIEALTPLRFTDDPEAAWLTQVLYRGLTRLDARMQPRPALAERWEISPDGLVITFTLRPDLRWSDGAPLTAEDVAYTWDLLRRWEPRSGIQADLQEYVAAVQAPRSDAVVFVLNRRLAALLADAAFPVLPRHIWEDLSPEQLLQADLLKRPVGSGPFLLKERRPGEALVLERNPHFYGPAPFLDQVAFLVAPDPTVAEMALRRGDLSIALLPYENWASLEQMPDPEVRTVRYPAPQYTFVGFNVRPESPFADRRLRQAWAYAIDREALLAEVMAGRAIPLHSPILPTNWAYDPTLPAPRQDLEKARALLQEAGWQDEDGDGVVEKDGRPLQVRLFVRADRAERVAAARRIAANLGQVGFAIEVLPADQESVIAAKLRPPYDLDALLMRWRNLGPDPDLFYLFHSSQVWEGPDDQRENLYNFVGYRSVEADDLLVAGRSTYDPEARRPIYAQLQALLAEDLPYDILWGDPRYLALDVRLTTDEGPVVAGTPYLFWEIERWYVQD